MYFVCVSLHACAYFGSYEAVSKRALVLIEKLCVNCEDWWSVNSYCREWVWDESESLRIVVPYGHICLKNYVYRCETSLPCPAERLLAMQASRSQEQENKCMADHGKELSCSDAKEGDRESPEEETHALMDTGLFQPIQDTRKKYDKIFGNTVVSFKFLSFKITPSVLTVTF